MASSKDLLTIGELARRAGVSTPALRFYEREGLIWSSRTGGNQRRYAREMLRRVAFVRAAQTVGLSLNEVREALGTLPGAQTPTRADWARLSKRWQTRLDEQIALLERLRDDLTSCIGCGCLSFRVCSLYNRNDQAAGLGSGARYLLGDTADDATRLGEHGQGAPRTR